MGTPLAFAKSLAQKTGDLLLDYYHSNQLVTELKSDGSVLTEADLAADRLITTSIRNSYPEDLLISEEHPTAFSELELESGRNIWIIDPLDGTTNFSLGLPIWGVILTRLMDGLPEIAVSYFPLLGEMYSARRGLGAFLNDAILRIDSNNPKRRISFFACCSRTFKDYQVSVPYKMRILGSAAYSMCAVVKSTAILAFETTPKLWDIAAGWLLVSEAGGVIESFDLDQPFPLKSGFDYSRKNYPTLAAADREILKRARAQLTPVNLSS